MTITFFDWNGTLSLNHPNNFDDVLAVSHTEMDRMDVWLIRMHRRYHTAFHPVQDKIDRISPTYSVRPVNFRIFDLYLKFLVDRTDEKFTLVESAMKENKSWQEKRN